MPCTACLLLKAEVVEWLLSVDSAANTLPTVRMPDAAVSGIHIRGTGSWENCSSTYSHIDPCSITGMARIYKYTKLLQWQAVG